MNNRNFVERLPILVLYPHSRCNCRCVMCDSWKDRTVKEIGVSDLERHVKDIETLGVRWAVLSGGEPLMHSDLSGLSAILRVLGIRVTALSTGLLLERNASLVVHSFDDMIVSLDGPQDTHDRIRGVQGAFELLAAGVRAVHTIHPGFPIAARCTVQRGNFAQLRETVRIARKLDLQSVSFLPADVTSTAFNHRTGWSAQRQENVALTADETDELENEVEWLIAELPDLQGFVLEAPEKLRRIVRHFRAHLELIEPMAPRCNAPWVSAVIESDGTVRPCFFHPPLGSIREQPLTKILNGPQAIEFRRALEVAHDPICRRCVCSLFFAGRV